MRRPVMSAGIILVLVFVALAAEFKPYAGAVLDERATRDSNAAMQKSDPGAAVSIYTTPDAFAKVAAFYKGLGAEYAMPMASGTAGKPKKRGEYELWEAYFLLDGAQDLDSSRAWVKVQRPAVGLYRDDPKVRDVTAIILTRKK